MDISKKEIEERIETILHELDEISKIVEITEQTEESKFEQRRRLLNCEDSFRLLRLNLTM